MQQPAHVPPVCFHIRHFATYPNELQLYSIQRAVDAASFAADFFTRMRKLAATDLILRAQLELFEINVDRIARRNRSLFEHNCLRPEEKAAALPSKDRYLRSLGLEPPIDLRLYCFPAGPRTLILFNGDVKTHDDPEQCPQVRPHFLLAKRLGRILEKECPDWELTADNRLPSPLSFDFR